MYVKKCYLSVCEAGEEEKDRAEGGKDSVFECKWVRLHGEQQNEKQKPLKPCHRRYQNTEEERTLDIV